MTNWTSRNSWWDDSDDVQETWYTGSQSKQQFIRLIQALSTLLLVQFDWWGRSWHRLKKNTEEYTEEDVGWLFFFFSTNTGILSMKYCQYWNCHSDSYLFLKLTCAYNTYIFVLHSYMHALPYACKFKGYYPGALADTVIFHYSCLLFADGDE